MARQPETPAAPPDTVLIAASRRPGYRIAGLTYAETAVRPRNTLPRKTDRGKAVTLVGHRRPL